MSIVSLEGVIDELYRNLSERDVVTNVFDYTKRVARWLYTKFGLGRCGGGGGGEVGIVMSAISSRGYAVY